MPFLVDVVGSSAILPLTRRAWGTESSTIPDGPGKKHLVPTSLIATRSLDRYLFAITTLLFRMLQESVTLRTIFFHPDGLVSFRCVAPEESSHSCAFTQFHHPRSR